MFKKNQKKFNTFISENQRLKICSKKYEKNYAFVLKLFLSLPLIKMYFIFFK